MLLIERLDHRSPPTAARMHAIMALAYAQEAEVMGVQQVPAFPTTRTEIEASRELYLGAFEVDELVGCAGFGPDDEPGQYLVSSLVVHPSHQRRGIGRALMAALLSMCSGHAIAVATGTMNLPALALYRGLGFVPYRYGSIGPEELPLVKLRRAGR